SSVAALCSASRHVRPCACLCLIRGWLRECCDALPEPSVAITLAERRTSASDHLLVADGCVYGVNPIGLALLPERLPRLCADQPVRLQTARPLERHGRVVRLAGQVLAVLAVRPVLRQRSGD